MVPSAICGAIGAWDEATFERLRAASGARALVGSAAADEPRWALAATGTVLAWRSQHQRGWLWASIAGDREPNSWREAAVDRLACGLAIDGTAIRLHGDALGVGRLYVRAIGSALYFSNRIRPLTALQTGSTLTPDLDAWSSILTLGAPLGDATPFAEIRRVDAATAWVYERGSLTCERFEPLGAPDGLAASAPQVADLVGAISAAIPKPSWRKPLHLTLSGGWDSRLLAGLTTRSSHRWVTAWTTSPDDGHDLDVALARPVAAAMSLRHREVLPEAEAWLQCVAEARQRVEHQTWMHTWLVPLVERMHGLRGVVVDGLAGDVLFKGLFVDHAVLSGESEDERRRQLWRQLGGARCNSAELLIPSTAAAVTAMSWVSYLGATDRLHGRADELPASVLLTRTARAIAPSPLELFAPECSVCLPFLAPEVVRAGLRIAPEQKLDGALYRELLRAGAPQVADLPSTNDSAPGARGPRRQTSAAAVCSLRDSIRSQPPVLGLLGPGLRRIVDAPDPASALGASTGNLAVLQGLATFADWLTLYEPLLADVDLQGWLR